MGSDFDCSVQRFEAMMSFVCEKKLQRRPWVKLKAVFWQGNSEGISDWNMQPVFAAIPPFIPFF